MQFCIKDDILCLGCFFIHRSCTTVKTRPSTAQKHTEPSVSLCGNCFYMIQLHNPTFQFKGALCSFVPYNTE